MLYRSFALNGAWEMDYQEEKYISTKPPIVSGDCRIEQAVPGYWEDMAEVFRQTPFFRKLRINPEYGLQCYPMAGNLPDMALPNVIGNFFYCRSFHWNMEEWEKGNDKVIHFEGVQNAVSVWINDVFLGRHEGYSTPFDMRIPECVLKDGENKIMLSVSNHRLEGYSGEPVSGLTSRAANEYAGGITGDVEIRIYNSPLRDATIYVSENCEEVTVWLEMKEDEKTSCENGYTWAVMDSDCIRKQGCNTTESFTFDTSGLEYWSPEHPKQYILEISCGGGLLQRRFGIRRLTAEGNQLLLNGVPYYLRGICEHCYFPESIHPVHDQEYYCNIIKKVKSLGFNFIRFHTWVPPEEYLQAADTLGMLVHVECPNNTPFSEWKEIVSFCRRHTSVVIYCGGNELLMDEPFIEYLRCCGDYVHKSTDALFSPMSALRGLEYLWIEPDQEKETVEEPFKHHPRRLKIVGEFSDLYSSYPNGQHSYFSLDGDSETVDAWNVVYQKPRISHEICIDGTYTDLSLKNRYQGTRVGRTEMFSSIEHHLAEKGLLQKAPIYFRNSSEWQRRIRKYCFELVRRSNTVAGYDFLGPIDTHWHTFGYDVGMMNEFYELKPGESVRNVLMYNGATVLLTDLGRKTNFQSGESIDFGVYVSHYGKRDMKEVQLTIRLSLNGEVIERETVVVGKIKNGFVSKIHEFQSILPMVEKPGYMKLYFTLDGDEVFAENEWELYLFPAGNKIREVDNERMKISRGMSLEELTELLEEGKDVLLLGTEPFTSLPTTFRIALAGRNNGNLATIVSEHPLLRDLPCEGYCGWQFAELLEGGQAICFDCDVVPFAPIVEVASTHKFVIRQAALFEFNVMKGRLLVCGFNFKEEDAAAQWLYNRLINYMQSDYFLPEHTIDGEQLRALTKEQVKEAAGNSNFAFNVNDKTAVRGKK